MTLMNTMTAIAMIPACGGILFVLGIFVQRLFTYAFLAGAHLRFWQYMRFKGRRVPYQGLALLHYLWRESHAMSVLVWWRILQLFRFDVLVFQKAPKAPLLDDNNAEITEWIPVLGIHGYTQNASNLWGIRKALAQRGRASTAVDLGLPFLGIENYTAALQEGIKNLLRAHPQASRIDVVCHSMGGLVMRKLLADKPELKKSIRKIITLGSPHQGTAATRGPFAVGKDAQQMSRNHTFVNTLPSIAESAPNIEHIAIAATQDYIVYPRESSLPVDAKHIVLKEPGHAGLLVHDAALQTIVAALS